LDVAENLQNVGSYTLQLQAMLNESGGVTVVSGKHLPSHVVHFSITGLFQSHFAVADCVGSWFCSKPLFRLSVCEFVSQKHVAEFW